MHMTDILTRHSINRALTVFALAAMFVLAPAALAPVVLAVGDQLFIAALALLTFIAGDWALEPVYRRRGTALSGRAWASCAGGFVTAAVLVTQIA